MSATVLFKISGGKNDNHEHRQDKCLYLRAIHSTLFKGFIKIEFMGGGIILVNETHLQNFIIVQACQIKQVMF